MKPINERYRQIHLDFHTSESCEDVGSRFDENQFIEALQAGHVNCINVFGLCHHGWCYYPARSGKPHPTLQTDLLGRMLKACEAAGIQTVVYVSVGWNERVFREHPEWACRGLNGDLFGPREVHPSSPRPFYGWHRLCFNTPYLEEAVLPVAREIAERYRPSGFWFDITGPATCACPACVAGAARVGLDPAREEDLKRYGLQVFKDYLRRTSEAVWEILPGASIYHNSSNEPLREDESLLNYYSHLEIESLPTGFWGYEFFPVAAKYFKPRHSEAAVVGMTGKFHLSWGEFGGFKSAEALRYECARMTAHACLPCVGDQLHPSGEMDRETYRLIGAAYAEIERWEPWLEGAQPIADVAILSPRGMASDAGHDKARDSEFGACQALMETHVPHVIVGADANFDPYRLLVLPDCVRADARLAKRLSAFVDKGGALLLSGMSGVSDDGNGFALDTGAEYLGASSCDVEYIRPRTAIAAGLVASPILVYESAARVQATDGETLADTHEPIFNRTYGRFCSHRNSPPQPRPSRPAIVRKGRVIHISQPIFRAYRQFGALLHRRLIDNCMSLIYPDRFVEVDMPSAGEVAVTRQAALDRLIIHLLYAAPLKRGDVRVIDDVVDLFDVPVRLRSDRAPKRVYLAPEETPLDFTHEAGRIVCRLAQLSLSAKLVFDFHP